MEEKVDVAGELKPKVKLRPSLREFGTKKQSWSSNKLDLRPKFQPKRASRRQSVGPTGASGDTSARHTSMKAVGGLGGGSTQDLDIPAKGGDSFIAGGDNKVMQAYLPSMLKNHVRFNDQVTTAAETIKFKGPVLFADVSGFSSLGDALISQAQASEESQQELSDSQAKSRIQSSSHLASTQSLSVSKAADRLQLELNAILSAMIDCVSNHGGDVISFCGDAIVTVFPCQDALDDINATVARSAMSALSMLQVAEEIHEMEVSDLDVHVGIDAGESEFVIVGGVDGRWLYFIAGEPCQNSFRVDGLGKRHWVMLTPQVLDHLQAFIKADDGRWDLEYNQMPDINAVRLLKFSETQQSSTFRAVQKRNFQVPMHDAFLGPYVGALCTNAEDTSTLQKVAVLFAHFILPGDREPTLADFQTITEHMQRSAKSFGAGIRQLVVDDKGIVGIAIMGIHPFVHARTADQLCLMGIDLQKQLRKAADITVAAGVASGISFFGQVGNSSRMDRAVVGDSVNISARLMGLAGLRKIDEGILSEEKTCRGIHDTQLEVLDAGQVPLKGKKKMIRVFRVTLKRKRRGQTVFGRVGMDSTGGEYDSIFLGRQLETNQAMHLCGRGLRATVAKKGSSGNNGGDDEPTSKMIVIVGTHGIGKTRFLIHMHGLLTKQKLRDPLGRVSGSAFCLGYECDKIDTVRWRMWKTLLVDLLLGWDTAVKSQDRRLAPSFSDLPELFPVSDTKASSDGKAVGSSMKQAIKRSSSLVAVTSSSSDSGRYGLDERPILYALPIIEGILKRTDCPVSEYQILSLLDNEEPSAADLRALSSREQFQCLSRVLQAVFGECARSCAGICFIIDDVHHLESGSFEMIREMQDLDKIVFLTSTTPETLESGGTWNQDSSRSAGVPLGTTGSQVVIGGGGDDSIGPSIGGMRRVGSSSKMYSDDSKIGDWKHGGHFEVRRSLFLARAGVVSLPPFSAFEISIMMDLHVGARLGNDVLRRVVRRGRGHPQQSLETILGMLDRGVGLRTGGEGAHDVVIVDFARRTESRRDSKPGRVTTRRGSIGDREDMDELGLFDQFNDLPLADQRVLQVCAVAGSRMLFSTAIEAVVVEAVKLHIPLMSFVGNDTPKGIRAMTRRSLEELVSLGCLSKVDLSAAGQAVYRMKHSPPNSEPNSPTPLPGQPDAGGGAWSAAEKPAPRKITPDLAFESHSVLRKDRTLLHRVCYNIVTENVVKGSTGELIGVQDPQAILAHHAHSTGIMMHEAFAAFMEASAVSFDAKRYARAAQQLDECIVMVKADAFDLDKHSQTVLAWLLMRKGICLYYENDVNVAFGLLAEAFSLLGEGAPPEGVRSPTSSTRMLRNTPSSHQAGPPSCIARFCAALGLGGSGSSKVEDVTDGSMLSDESSQAHGSGVPNDIPSLVQHTYNIVSSSARTWRKLNQKLARVNKELQERQAKTTEESMSKLGAIIDVKPPEIIKLTAKRTPREKLPVPDANRKSSAALVPTFAARKESQESKMSSSPAPQPADKKEDSSATSGGDPAKEAAQARRSTLKTVDVSALNRLSEAQREDKAASKLHEARRKWSSQQVVAPASLSPKADLLKIKRRGTAHAIGDNSGQLGLLALNEGGAGEEGEEGEGSSSMLMSKDKGNEDSDDGSDTEKPMKRRTRSFFTSRSGGKSVPRPRSFASLPKPSDLQKMVANDDSVVRSKSMAKREKDRPGSANSGLPGRRASACFEDFLDQHGVEDEEADII